MLESDDSEPEEVAKSQKKSSPPSKNVKANKENEVKAAHARSAKIPEKKKTRSEGLALSSSLSSDESENGKKAKKKQGSAKKKSPAKKEGSVSPVKEVKEEPATKKATSNFFSKSTSVFANGKKVNKFVFETIF